MPERRIGESLASVDEPRKAVWQPVGVARVDQIRLPAAAAETGDGVVALDVDVDRQRRFRPGSIAIRQSPAGEALPCAARVGKVTSVNRSRPQPSGASTQWQ